jgi:hypothetical protein
VTLRTSGRGLRASQMSFIAVSTVESIETLV